IPSTVWLTSVTATTNGTATATTTADPLTPAGVGTLSFQGGATKYAEVAGWLDAIDRIVALDGGTLAAITLKDSADATSKDGPVTYSNGIVVTPQALSHRFDRKDS